MNQQPQANRVVLSLSLTHSKQCSIAKISLNFQFRLSLKHTEEYRLSFSALSSHARSPHPI